MVLQVPIAQRGDRFEQISDCTAGVTVTETEKNTKEVKVGSGAGPVSEHLSRVLKAESISGGVTQAKVETLGRVGLI